MAAVELQRQADGKAFVTLRSSGEEKRFKDIACFPNYRRFELRWMVSRNQSEHGDGGSFLVPRPSGSSSTPPRRETLHLSCSLPWRIPALPNSFRTVGSPIWTLDSTDSSHAVSSIKTCLQGDHQQRTASFLEMPPTAIATYRFPRSSTTLHSRVPLCTATHAICFQFGYVQLRRRPADDLALGKGPTADDGPEALSGG